MEFSRQHMAGILLSMLLHGVLIALLTAGIDLPSNRKMRPPVEHVAIEATVVDESLIRQEMARLDALEQEELRRQEEELRRREEERRRAAEERQRAEQQAEEARRQLEQERQRLEDVRVRREEAERQERLRLAELERRRAVEEEAAREAERQRLAQEKKRREEEERRRQEERERQRRVAEEARRQAEAQAELAQALAAEEEARRREEAATLAAAMDEYIRLIQNRIQQNWIPPASTPTGLQCRVHVTQIPSGDVIHVDVRGGECNGDEAVVRSIEVAVRKTSPLPKPSIPSLFDRNLVITFRPEA